ncbi:hypothetical protein PR048_023038 [Dryococelus australis]|uniref:Uncharacterized protein n=1 Tax=Dryococelus australis TaxID=614101 RepID=A0ABQ9GT07_9NEOP|nr:hypothetical protein PR048_023038 [Dryococelus australis]
MAENGLPLSAPEAARFYICRDLREPVAVGRTVAKCSRLLDSPLFIRHGRERFVEGGLSPDGNRKPATSITQIRPGEKLQHSRGAINWGRGGLVVRLLASHQRKPGLIPGGAVRGFSYLGIVPGSAAVVVGLFQGPPPPPYIPALPHSHPASPSSALETSVSRGAQISSTHSQASMLNGVAGHQNGGNFVRQTAPGNLLAQAGSRADSGISSQYALANQTRFEKQDLNHDAFSPLYIHLLRDVVFDPQWFSSDFEMNRDRNMRGRHYVRVRSGASMVGERRSDAQWQQLALYVRNRITENARAQHSTKYRLEHGLSCFVVTPGQRGRPSSLHSEQTGPATAVGRGVGEGCWPLNFSHPRLFHHSLQRPGGGQTPRTLRQDVTPARGRHVWNVVLLVLGVWNLRDNPATLHQPLPLRGAPAFLLSVACVKCCKVNWCLLSAVHTRCTQQGPVTRVGPGETQCTASTHERAARHPSHTLYEWTLVSFRVVGCSACDTSQATRDITRECVER